MMKTVRLLVCALSSVGRAIALHAKGRGFESLSAHCMQKRLQAIVSGRVQGVTYRDFAREEAKKLGLVGFVKNMPRERVEVVAEGEEKVLRQFCSQLQIGPAFAEIEKVDLEWPPATGEFTDFKIHYQSFDRF